MKFILLYILKFIQLFFGAKLQEEIEELEDEIEAERRIKI